MRADGRFEKDDPRINRKGKPPGPNSLVKVVLVALGSDGRDLFGGIMARLLLKGRLEFPGVEALMSAGVPAKTDDIPKPKEVTVDQYLAVVRHFCPTATKGGEEDAEAVADFKALHERVSAAKKAVNE